MSKRIFTAYIQQDEESGLFYGFFPDVRGAHSQADNIEELKNNLAEVLKECLEHEKQMNEKVTFNPFISTFPVEAYV